MVAGVKPAVIGMAEAIEFADVDHRVLPLREFVAASKMAALDEQSSVMAVTEGLTTNRAFL
jgi:hypothetical protein